MDQSPSSLTLYLKYNNKIKKYVLPEGRTGLTLERLQLAFVEKFAWNTHYNGVDSPKIYIEDPKAAVSYELEDLSDVNNRSVLLLKVEAPRGQQWDLYCKFPPLYPRKSLGRQ